MSGTWASAILALTASSSSPCASANSFESTVLSPATTSLTLSGSKSTPLALASSDSSPSAATTLDSSDTVPSAPFTFAASFLALSSTVVAV